MQIQRSRFENDDIERLGVGAGIIPVCFVEGSEPMLLLGRERFLPQWKGSCRWSGFEGSRKAGETLMETALREFNEESIGVVMPFNDIKERVQNGDYWMRVILKISNERRTERYHATYVTVIPWDPSIVDTFLKRRNDIERIERLADDFERLFPTFAYKADIFMEIGDVTCCDDVVTLTRFPTINVEDHMCGECQLSRDTWSDIDEEEDVLLQTVCEGEEDDRNSAPEARVEWFASDDGGEKISFPPSHPYASRLLAWDAVRKRLEEQIFSHECIRVCRGPNTNRVQHVNIHTDYLEKDQVRWWALSDLRRVLDMRGYLGNECFRPYFLPVLQTVLHEISMAQNRKQRKCTNYNRHGARPSFSTIVRRGL